MGSFERGAGILLHPTSLPSGYGIGEIGGSIFKFIDFLDETNQKYWQVLPLGPTGYGDSPYQSFSSFAGNPNLISIEQLIADGLLSKEDIDSPEFNSKRVEYGKIIPFKEKVLKLAFENFENSDLDKKKFNQFKEDQEWLHYFAAFMALKQKFELKPWYAWPETYHTPNSSGTIKFIETHEQQIEYFKFVQFIFDLQWNRVKDYANQKGISIIGDIPIFVAYDSTDTWANREIFLMNEDSSLQYVAGVPPDYFSATGQLWGNPIYDWEKCKENEYDFWTRRVERTLDLCDIIRIDHFRGFESYWRVPAEAETAIDGKWVKGPGGSLFEHLRYKLGELPLIAEDLGVITPEVTALRERFGMPGMVILQYGFSKSQDPSNGYLPHNHDENSVVYSGTHDNDTSLGWYNSSAREIKDHFLAYTQSDGDDIAGEMIQLAHSSVANMAILPLQDILRKKSTARMNFPGKAFGNWQWRFNFDEIDDSWQEELRKSTNLYERS